MDTFQSISESSSIEASLTQQKLTLLAQSVADPLFNNPALHEAWWAIWGNPQFQLADVTVDSNGELLLHLPLYIDAFKFKKVLKLRRLQFIGTNYQNFVTPRLEYLEFIIRNNHINELKPAFKSLIRLKWDEFVLRDIRVNGTTSEFSKSFAYEYGWLVRTIHKDIAYNINTSGSFQEYLQSRSKSTRLKLYNRRKLLESHGKVKLENYFPDKVDIFFELLELYHLQRWGDAFSTKSLSFHKHLIKKMDEQGADISLSVLKVNGKCESLLYDIQINGVTYNIQSGYNTQFSKKISLGTLHFGYAIEEAFCHSEVYRYDFLAGGGKRAQYKESLSTDKFEIESLQIVRSRKLILLYKIKDKLSALIQRPLSSYKKT